MIRIYASHEDYPEMEKLLHYYGVKLNPQVWYDMVHDMVPQAEPERNAELLMIKRELEERMYIIANKKRNGKIYHNFQEYL